MRVVYCILSLTGALILELVVGEKLAIHGVRPPFFFFTLAYWFWSIPFSVRLWIAIGAGVVVDSISFFPFGVFTVVFTIEAGCVEILQFFLSNVKSFFTKALGIGCMLVTFFCITSFAVSFISYFFGQTIPVASFISPGSIGAVLVWSFVLPLFLYSAEHLFERR